MPLRIDRLPAEVKESIIHSRAAGLTWAETATFASAKAGQMLSRTSVQRWFDLRIEQPQQDSAGVAASLREIIGLLKSILAAVRA